MLKSVQMSSEGSYLCEVSGEAPPDDGPIISGSLPRYKSGDTISANCSSHNSLPAATLNWYINGEEATPAMLINYPVLETSRGRLTSILGLRLVVKDKTFGESGDIKIKCTATIETIYWRSNEESIQGKGHARNNGIFNYDTSKFSWSSAAHPIVSASPTTLESETKLIAAVLLHLFWIIHIFDLINAKTPKN